MTERPLFRPEAVEHHARGLVTNRRQLDLSNKTTTRAFYGLLLLIALALFAALSIEANESARGAAESDDQGNVVVLVPIGAAQRLRLGQPVTIDHDGRELSGTVVSAGEPLAGPPAVVPVTTSIRAQLGDARPEAVIRLDRRRVAYIVLPPLERIFGGDDA